MHADYVLVGGGLQNGLVALAVAAHQPAARIAMIERGAAPGGNHTWCFHAGDLSPAMQAWIDPLVVARWDGYDVAFPQHARTLASPYACVSSDRLAERVTEVLARPGSQLLTRTSAVEVHADRVVVKREDGALETVTGTAVIDARGPDTDTAPEACGWQKFVGQELRLTAPHGLQRPMLMDATLPQVDGFRFMYVLPLSADRVLVEDTYFSDKTRIDAKHLRSEIARYVAARDWQIAEVVREETGVLPLPWKCPPPVATAPLVGGYAGGWFHPVTGYSFPIAARLAALVAGQPANTLFGPALQALVDQQAKQMKFALRLNTMLFKWFPPDQRFQVLSRFYRLPEPVIRRFYALAMTAMDRARIVVGRPPKGLSIAAALGFGKSAGPVEAT